MFASFSSWSEVLCHADSGRSLYYQAPLDTAPRPVLARKLFKNGKIRLDAGEVVFTADSGHLSRFRRRSSEPTPRLIIEICPHEPRTSPCLMNGDEVSADPEVAQHLADCNASGDCEDACLYVVRHVGVVFRIVARNAAGEFENRLATAEEKAATARAIYFDSEADFDDESTVDTYLVWDAARDAGEES